MVKVSLCMIVKNEEHTLERCLSSIADAVDEIVIADTGSTDRTKEIAESYGARVADFPWIDDFAAARNFAFALAREDYILWLDADDLLKPDDLERFRLLKESLDPTVDAVSMHYHLGFDSFGNLTTSLRRNRLVKRANQYQWIGAVHEYMAVWGNIVNSDIAVTHCGDDGHGDRNLRIYLNRLSAGESLTPRDTYYFANELLDHRLFELAAHYYEKFLHQGQGWIEDNIAACGKLADCFHHLGDERKQLDWTVKALEYDSPRPETCCRLGFRFLQRNELNAAVFWYETAIAQAAKAMDSWGVVNSSCSTWLPHLQLCVCYDRLGQHQLAYEHNKQALLYRPGDPSMLSNKAYLESILSPPEHP